MVKKNEKIEIEIHGSADSIIQEDRLKRLIEKIREQTKDYPHIKIKIICGQ